MRIDVHAHYYPAALYELLERLTGQPQRRLGPAAPGFAPHVSIPGQLELMDAAGIDCMVMSLGNTPPYHTGVDVAATAAR